MQTIFASIDKLHFYDESACAKGARDYCPYEAAKGNRILVFYGRPGRGGACAGVYARF